MSYGSYSIASRVDRRDSSCDLLSVGSFEGLKVDVSMPFMLTEGTAELNVLAMNWGVDGGVSLAECVFARED